MYSHFTSNDLKGRNMVFSIKSRELIGSSPVQYGKVNAENQHKKTK